MWDPPAYAFPDEWADNVRTMPEGGPFPGRWSTDRTPYLRAPLRALADPQYDTVCVMLARQMGKTEIPFNFLGWMWQSCPAPALFITATEKLARSMSSDRFEQLFESTPDLRDRMRAAKIGALERFVAGVRFGIGWAGSRTEVASHPAKYAFVDERSRMTDDVGGEGDPVRIVQEGGAAFPGATIAILSSPTEQDLCPTFGWWLQGTRMRWCWRCPSCGEWFFPCLAAAGYPDGADYATIRAESWMACPACEHRIHDHERHALEQDYIPSVLDDATGALTLAPGLEVRNSVASYWATGFSSPIRTIGQIMERYARAARTGKPGDLQSIVNTAAGELWQVAGEGVAADDVRERRVESIPGAEVQLVTVGVDVQEFSLYYIVRGWGFAATSWLLDHDEIHGQPAYDDVWLALSRALDDTFCGQRPAMVLVDSGYQAAQVYQHCRLRPNWAPARGHDRLDRPYKDSLVDETVTGRALKTLRLWHHDNDVWKTWLYARMRWPHDQPGGWYVPPAIDDEYCRQVTNERHRTQRGKRVWYRTGNRRNHYLDCEILASVAADIQGVRRLRPLADASDPGPSTLPPAEPPAPASRPPPSQPRIARRPLGGGGTADW